MLSDALGQMNLSPFPADGRRELLNLELHVAHACNLTCEGCRSFFQRRS